ncbi:MAG: hypothetical protein N2653_05315 [Burkholderiales bacterium]|nr:hypothetical protein [Burkholderiales bacterium]
MKLARRDETGRAGIARASLCASVAALGFLVAEGARAARPMVTDDARIVDAKACQLEAWVKRDRESTERWALPACNFTGNLEVTLGGTRIRDAEGEQPTDVVLQGKTLFRTLEPGGWSWGLVVGTVRHPRLDRERWLLGDLYAYVPATFSFREDRVIVHTNLGLLHEQASDRRFLTWGLGTELQLAAGTWLIAEAFGRNEGRPFYQAGVRHWIVRDRVQIDATFGDRLGRGGAERFFSIGVRLISPPFLP